ncbi:MAG: hypothetical protein WCB27_14980 [Thermoguttaceae bacterium]
MMLNSRSLAVAAVLAVLAAFVVQVPSRAADGPKVSTFAPAEDLARQADKYLDSLKNTVASKEEYEDSEGKVGREANTLAIIDLALGLHDKDNKYKDKAPALIRAAQDVAATDLIEAAQDVAKAKKYAAAKKAVAALDKVASADGKPGGNLKWEKVASLPDLMKQVPMVNTKLKFALSKTNFKKKAKDSAGYTAVIAAIAQGVIADTSATKNAEQVKLWQKFSKAMRDHAGAANAAIHQGDPAATDKAMTKLNQSCEDCHAVFKPGVAANGKEK